MLAYNSSQLVEDHTLRNLTPGTAYTVTVAVSPSASYMFCIVVSVRTWMCLCACQACTGGGCTTSPPAEVQLEESTPENVPAPLVTPLSPHALNISWTPPDTPNGENMPEYVKSCQQMSVTDFFYLDECVCLEMFWHIKGKTFKMAMKCSSANRSGKIITSL